MAHNSASTTAELVGTWVPSAPITAPSAAGSASTISGNLAETSSSERLYRRTRERSATPASEGGSRCAWQRSPSYFHSHRNGRPTRRPRAASIEGDAEAAMGCTGTPARTPVASSSRHTPRSSSALTRV